MEPYVLPVTGEPLSSTLGPPGYFPLLPTCPEEQLTAQTIVHGYRETTDALGISDASESTLTLVNASGIQPPSRVLQTIRSRIKGKLSSGPGRIPPTLATVANADALPARPHLRNASDEEFVSWLHELAGSHELPLLTCSLPEATSKLILLSGLWQARVPTVRAAWYIRLVYLSWCMGSGSSNAPASNPSAQIGRDARVGSSGPGGVPRPSPAVSKVTPEPAGAPPPPPPHLLDVTPEVAARCRAMWTTHLLEHMDTGVAAAIAAMSGQVPAAPAAGPTPYAPTPMTPYMDMPLSPAPAMDFLLDLATGPGAQGAGGAGSMHGVPGAGGRPLPSPSVQGAPTFTSATTVANQILSASASQIIEPAPWIVNQYFTRLACHTFGEGMGDPVAVIDWAHRHLSGQAGSGSGAGGAAGAARPAATAPAVAESESHRIAALASDAERYRASVVLPLLSAAVEGQALPPNAVKKLVALLLDLSTLWQKAATQQQSVHGAGSPPLAFDYSGSAHTGTAATERDGLELQSLRDLRRQAARIVHHVLTTSASTLLTLDILPQLLAEVAWEQQLTVSELTWQPTSPALLSQLSLPLRSLSAPSPPHMQSTATDGTLPGATTATDKQGPVTTNGHMITALQAMLGRAGGGQVVKGGVSTVVAARPVAPPVHPGPAAAASAYLAYVDAVASWEACNTPGTTLTAPLIAALPSLTPATNKSTATKAAEGTAVSRGPVRGSGLAGMARGTIQGSAGNGLAAEGRMAPVVRVAARARAMEAAVHPKVLSFSGSVAMQRLQSAYATQNVNLAYQQLLDATGKEGLRNLQAAVNIACDFAVTDPLALSPAFSQLLPPPTLAQGAQAHTAGTQATCEAHARMTFAACLLVRLHESVCTWIRSNADVPQEGAPGILRRRKSAGTGSTATGTRQNTPGPEGASGTDDTGDKRVLKASPPPYSVLTAVSVGKGLLQDALWQWLDAQPLHLPHTCEGAQCAGAARCACSWPSRDPLVLTAWLLHLEQVGVWSSVQYTSELISQGFLDPPRTTTPTPTPATQHAPAAPAPRQSTAGHTNDIPLPALENPQPTATNPNEPSSSTISAAVRAARHWALLKLLHPKAVYPDSDTRAADSAADVDIRCRARAYAYGRRHLLGAWPELAARMSKVVSALLTVGNERVGMGGDGDGGAAHKSLGTGTSTEPSKGLSVQWCVRAVLESLSGDTSGLQGSVAGGLPTVQAWLHAASPAARTSFAAGLYAAVCARYGTGPAGTGPQHWAGYLSARVTQGSAQAATAAATVLAGPAATAARGGGGVVPVATPDVWETQQHASHGAPGISTHAAQGPLTAESLSTILSLLDQSGAHALACSLLLSLLSQQGLALRAQLETSTGSDAFKTSLSRRTSDQQALVPPEALLGAVQTFMPRFAALGAVPALLHQLLSPALLYSTLNNNRASMSPVSSEDLPGISTNTHNDSTTSANQQPPNTQLAGQLLGGQLRLAAAALVRYGGQAAKQVLTAVVEATQAAGAATTPARPRGEGGMLGELLVANQSGALHESQCGLWSEAVPGVAMVDWWLERFCVRLRQEPAAWQEWVLGRLRSLTDACAAVAPGDTAPHSCPPAVPPPAALPAGACDRHQLVASLMRQMRAGAQPDTVAAQSNSQLQQLVDLVRPLVQPLQQSQAPAIERIAEEVAKASGPGSTTLPQVQAHVAVLCTTLLLRWLDATPPSASNTTHGSAPAVPDTRLIQLLSTYRHKHLTPTHGAEHALGMVQQSVQAAAIAVLTASGPPSTQQGAQTGPMGLSVASWLVQATLYGLVTLSDVVQSVLNAPSVQQHPAMQAQLRAALLGAGLGPERLSPTSAHLLRLMQQSIDPHVLYQQCMPQLVQRAVQLCAKLSGRSQANNAAGTQEQACIDALLSCPSVGVGLLSDPSWLHEQLTSSGTLTAVAAAATAAGLPQPQPAGSTAGTAGPDWARLPFVVMVVMLQQAARGLPVAVAAVPQQTQGGKPPTWESDFYSVTSQLLGHVTSSNAPLTHVTLLLIIDQRRALDSLQNDTRLSMREALEQALGSAASASRTQNKPGAQPGPDKAGARAAGKPGTPQPWGAAPAVSSPAAGAPGGALATAASAPPIDATAAEKLLCNVIFARLLETPDSAVLYAELAFQLGPSVGSWLLRSVGWLLEDRSDTQLSGVQSLRQIIQKSRMPADKKGDSGLAARGSMATGDPVRASALHTAAGVELACPACAAAAQGVAARQGPWRVESALIPLTVVALSNVKTQLKPFAGELVRQLARAADLVKRATHAAASYTPATAASPADGGGDASADARPTKRQRTPSDPGRRGSTPPAGAAAGDGSLPMPPPIRVSNSGMIREASMEVDMDLGSPTSSVSRMGDDDASGAGGAHAAGGGGPERSLSGAAPSELVQVGSADYSAAHAPAGSSPGREAAGGAPAAAIGAGGDAGAGGGTKKRSFGQGRFGRGGVMRLGSAAGHSSSGAAAAAAVSAVDGAARAGGAKSALQGPTGLPLQGKASVDGSAAAAEPVNTAQGSVILGPPAALQVAVWLRLTLLLPLLPAVYIDKETDARKNLRQQLVPALMQLLASPVLQAPAQHAQHGQQGGHPLLWVLLEMARVSVRGYDGQAREMGAAATEAAVCAEEALTERLLNVFVGMVSGSTPSWPAWLKGAQAKKLKEVPAYPNTDILMSELTRIDAAVLAGSAPARATAAAARGASVSPDRDVPATPADVVRVLTHPATLPLLGQSSLRDILPTPNIAPWQNPDTTRTSELASYGGAGGGLRGSAERPQASRGVSAARLQPEGIPTCVRLELQSQLQGEAPVACAEVPRGVALAACGPQVFCSGPWGQRTVAVPALRHAAASAGLLNTSTDTPPNPTHATTQAGDRQAAQGAAEHDTSGSLRRSPPVPGGVGSVGEGSVLVNSWVPTPVESLSKCRHSKRLH